MPKRILFGDFLRPSDDRQAHILAWADFDWLRDGSWRQSKPHALYHTCQIRLDSTGLKPGPLLRNPR